MGTNSQFRNRAWLWLKRSALIDGLKFLLVVAVITWLMARGFVI